jgi:hypothetical protein
MQGSFAF